MVYTKCVYVSQQATRANLRRFCQQGSRSVIILLNHIYPNGRTPDSQHDRTLLNIGYANIVYGSANSP